MGSLNTTSHNLNANPLENKTMLTSSYKNLTTVETSFTKRTLCSEQKNVRNNVPQSVTFIVPKEQNILISLRDARL